MQPDVLHATDEQPEEATIHLGGFGVWQVNVGTAELFLNPRSRSFLGFAQDAVIDVSSCLERIHPDDRELMISDFNQAILSNGVADWNFEVRIPHPGHGTSWVAGFGQIERDETGKAQRVSGIAMELTNRKMLAVLHHKMEEKYRKLFESLSDPVVIVNMEGAIIECNQAYMDLTGYSERELFSMTYQDLTPERWHAFEASIVAEQIIPLGYSSTYEKEYRHKDGAIIPVELRTFLVRDSAGHPYQMWAIVRDISKRKASEIMILEWNRSLERRVEERTAALRQSRTRFRQLAETTFEAIAICEKGIIADGNTLLESMFGYELGQLIGKPLCDLAAEPSKECVSGQLLKEEDCSLEFTALRADGTPFPVEAHAREAPHRGRSARIIAIRDLTSAKLAESRIFAQQAKLDEVQRLALISEIAAGIIHQVGQPLSSMGLNVATAIKVLESCACAPCPAMRQLRAIEAEVGRMRELVMHMRSLADPAKAERKPCDLNHVIGNLRPVLEATARSRGVHLRFDCASELPLIEADAVQLSQVVLNLVKNAVEASSGQAVASMTVSITTSKLGPDRVRLTVQDHGTGIPEEVLERMFMPFISTKPDGLGVGLRLCRTIVEAHGGDITCCNNPDGDGATFLVTLPARCLPSAAGS